MSRLNELIDELCPNGVEYRKLGDFASISRGGSFQKKDFAEVGTPCIHYGQIYTRYGLFADTTFSFITDEAASKSRFASQNDIVMAVTSENVVDVCKCVAWLGSDDIAISGHTAIIKHDQNPKYLTYYFHSSMFFTQKVKIANGTKVIEVSPNKLKDILIPIPPLAIQEEIVSILDNFTELSNELSNELSARKKQYEFYRSTLMTFGNDTPLTKLDDIANFSYGYTDTAKIQGTARFIRITDIGENGKLNPNNSMYVDLSSENEKYLLEKGDILMARTGATFGKTMIFQEDTPALYASFLIRIRFAENTVLPEYYWHFAQSNLYWSQANKLVSKAGQPQFNANVLRTVVIPVPPIQEQQRIVNLLNKFDVLNNDLTNDLPAEIDARQKQYEYYRDKLLTFKELEG